MLNDTLTISLILVLLFGSIALYLYTCIQQSEQKISLLESILLDLKMSAEVKSYTELPSEAITIHSSESPRPSNTARPATPSGGSLKEEAYVPFEDATEEDDESQKSEDLTGNDALTGGTSITGADEIIEIDEYKSVISDAVTSSEQSNPNYEAMSLKELQSLAKSRNIVGVTKKGPLIEALKTSDRSSAVKPGSVNAVGSNSFLESSAPVSDEIA
jgi:hypothetical protein